MMSPRARCRHRRRRDPRACDGELLHLDGGRHGWLALDPDWRGTLITVVDDATKTVLYAQLWAQETLQAVMSALAEVFRREGLPMALYTDRARWAFHTPKAGGPVDKSRFMQVGRALHQLGVEHIPAYSPQARGRSEWVNRTLQGRVVNELRVAGVRTMAAANTYLHEVYRAQHNAIVPVCPARSGDGVRPARRGRSRHDALSGRRAGDCPPKHRRRRRPALPNRAPGRSCDVCRTAGDRPATSGRPVDDHAAARRTRS